MKLPITPHICRPHPCHLGVLIVCLAAHGRMLMALSPQTPSQTTLKTTQEYTDATALSEARIKYLTSQRTLASVEQPDPLAAATLAAGIATAKQSEAASKAAVVKTNTTVAESGYTGTVTAGSGAGGVEAHLLASRAVNEAAESIVKSSLIELLAGKTVALYAGADLPNFAPLTTFRAQFFLLQKALVDATNLLNQSKTANSPAGLVATRSAALVVGAALDAANKLLGFFRTDYAVNGVEVKLDDLLILNSLANQLLAQKRGVVVRTPSLYSPPALAENSGILAQLNTLAEDRNQLQESLGACRELQEGFVASAANEKDAGLKAEHTKSLENLKADTNQASTAMMAYDLFLTKLGTLDANGTVPLANIMQLDLLDTTLAHQGYLLSAKITSSGGSYYTRRNMWTLFGGMPFFNMGGVVVTYSLVDGSTGNIVAAGVLPVDGGYVKNNKLKAFLGSKAKEVK